MSGPASGSTRPAGAAGGAPGGPMGGPGGRGPMGGRGRGPMGGPMGMAMPVEKPKDFRGTLMRLIGELRPERPRILLVVVVAFLSVAGQVFGRRSSATASTS